MRELHDIFNQCVDRLAAGESIDAIVRDFPDHADDLRDLLTLGQLAGNMSMQAEELDTAQESGRSRLADLIFLSQNKEEPKMTQEKPKRIIRPITESRWKLPAAVVAGIALLIGGVLIGLFVAQRQATPVTPQIALNTDDACATLTPASYGQRGQNAVIQQEQATAMPPIEMSLPTSTAMPTGTPVSIASIETTATSLAATLSILATPAPMDAPEEPMSEFRGAETGASAFADGEEVFGGYGGGDALPATGGGGADAATVLGRSDTAVTVPEGAPIVATSVVSFDDRSRDESAMEMPPEREVAETTTTELDKASSDGVADADTTTGSLSFANEQQQLQPLRAGEIDDNADWDVYQEYRNNYFRQYSASTVNDKDVSDRQIIRVVDENGLPILGACVQVYNGEWLIVQNRTFATGMTMFFPELLDRTRYIDTFTVVVSKNGVSQQVTLDRNAIGDTLTVAMPLSQQATSQQLDVMFLIDATGSMSDEIQQLQDNILQISKQINALPDNVDTHYGMVAYRDLGDAYVTKVFDFTPNVQDFQRALLRVQADGGGDYPEALNEGLNEALNSVQWRDENTVKLVFLVADAPPHLDYNNGLDYSLMMFDALARGIKIHPIASSGLQPEGEYIMRQIAQVTMGHFVFLTYEGGTPGTPGDDRPDLEVGTPEDAQGIGDYSVAQLDELVLRLITDELAALRGEQ